MSELMKNSFLDDLFFDIVKATTDALCQEGQETK